MSEPQDLCIWTIRCDVLLYSAWNTTSHRGDGGPSVSWRSLWSRSCGSSNSQLKIISIKKGQPFPNAGTMTAAEGVRSGPGPDLPGHHWDLFVSLQRLSERPPLFRLFNAVFLNQVGEFVSGLVAVETDLWMSQLRCQSKFLLVLSQLLVLMSCRDKDTQTVTWWVLNGPLPASAPCVMLAFPPPTLWPSSVVLLPIPSKAATQQRSDTLAEIFYIILKLIEGKLGPQGAGAWCPGRTTLDTSPLFTWWGRIVDLPYFCLFVCF